MLDFPFSALLSPDCQVVDLCRGLSNLLSSPMSSLCRESLSSLCQSLSMWSWQVLRMSPVDLSRSLSRLCRLCRFCRLCCCSHNRTLRTQSDTPRGHNFSKISAGGLCPPDRVAVWALASRHRGSVEAASRLVSRLASRCKSIYCNLHLVEGLLKDERHYCLAMQKVQEISSSLEHLRFEPFNQSSTQLLMPDFGIHSAQTLNFTSTFQCLIDWMAQIWDALAKMKSLELFA